MLLRIWNHELALCVFVAQNYMIYVTPRKLHAKNEINVIINLSCFSSLEKQIKVLSEGTHSHPSPQ